jgi:hypothetical protein
MKRGEMYPLFLQVDEVISVREPGVVVEITTPRLSDPIPTCPVAHERYWGENLDGGKIDINALATLERPNLAALVATSSCIPARIEAINRELPSWPPQEVYDTGVQSSLWRYADDRANVGKNKYIRLCQMVMIVSVTINLGTTQQAWQAAGFLIVLAAVLFFPKLQSGPKLDFIQWRCLAESLLVTDLWSAVGVNVDTALVS